jgi:translation initiation factor eIF-2B subunit epsilon
VAVAMSKRVVNLIESGKSPKNAVAGTIPNNKRLIKGCVDIKREDEQAEFLLFLQTDLVHRPQGDKVLLFVANALATNDLVEAEGFEQWWEDPRSSASEELKKVRADTKQLVDVLVGDDEEEDDEEDEEEESEEDDDDDE